ncbi:hypothetical protein [Sporolactobacillus putidus]|uniref:mRNA interferase RelE/StbE n=1 Tax=Sporolactobacillus putidus TaxID=492735 RepID=A0A917VYR5_9BACL|nr:hypothetical protein [Sporolactobacillus putidus]GGL40077.1 hypothetical protein GCM10007968_00040 [Sporolactobacillus putidus]
MAKFKLEYIDENARKEFDNLDGSTKAIVRKSYRKLEYRADEIGKQLSGKLHECKEIKLRHIGIRIIFHIVHGLVQIVQIITINKREDKKVFEIAED